MKSKPVLPINELVNEIRKKGIQIDDENFVSEVLTRLNYQRLLAYRNKFLLSQNPEVYKEGTNFNDIYRLYKFDRELKFILQKNIESIELMMRTLTKLLEKLKHLNNCSRRQLYRYFTFL